jgi:Polyketide cyclase / dehydrase and lipid transport
VKTFDVQTIEINAPFDRVFDYVADAQRLPEWTNAFKSISSGRAVMETAPGLVEIELAVHAARSQGTVDWIMTFPDGSVARAYSRAIVADKERSLFSFILMAPPVPLEQLEGAFEAQSHILQEELAKLGSILNSEK